MRVRKRIIAARARSSFSPARLDAEGRRGLDCGGVATMSSPHGCRGVAAPEESTQ